MLLLCLIKWNELCSVGSEVLKAVNTTPLSSEMTPYILVQNYLHCLKFNPQNGGVYSSETFITFCEMTQIRSPENHSLMEPDLIGPQ
jgi:hypothetical protein